MDKQTAADLLDNLIGMVDDSQGNDYDTALRMGIKALREERHGHWIIPRFGADAKCSVCGYYFNDAYDMENEDNYCRHCGASMRGE